MPKGKKYDAAEKHFIKKEETLRREIKELRERLRDTRQSLENSLAAENRLIVENAALKQERDRLLELQGLTLSEVQQLIRDEHKKAESAQAVASVMSISKGLLRY